jgi:hypothetical protein
MIKLTFRKDSPNSIKVWLEGFEDREIKDGDLQEVLNMIDCARGSVIGMLEKRMKLEAENKKVKLKLIK